MALVFITTYLDFGLPYAVASYPGISCFLQFKTHSAYCLETFKTFLNIFRLKFIYANVYLRLYMLFQSYSVRTNNPFKNYT